MKQRFNVSSNGSRIGSVVAESADDAIRIACKMTNANPDDCTAVEVTTRRTPQNRAMEMVNTTHQVTQLKVLAE